MGVVTGLRAMTLTAQVHHLRKPNLAAIGVPQTLVVLGVVAREAGQLPMLELQSLVKVFEIVGAAGGEIRRACGVARVAAYFCGLAISVKLCGFNPRRPVRCANSDSES
jgi:hypothetical protein